MFVFIKSIPILGAIIESFSNYFITIISFFKLTSYKMNSPFDDKIKKSFKFLETGIIIYFLIVSSFLFFGLTKFDIVFLLLFKILLFSVSFYYMLSFVSMKILDIRILLINLSYAYGVLFPLQGLSEIFSFTVMSSYISQGNFDNSDVLNLMFVIQFLLLGIPSIVIFWKLVIVAIHKSYIINKGLVIFSLIISSGIAFYFYYEVYKYFTTIPDKVKDLFMLVI